MGSPQAQELEAGDGAALVGESEIRLTGIEHADVLLFDLLKPYPILDDGFRIQHQGGVEQADGGLMTFAYWDPDFLE